MIRVANEQETDLFVEPERLTGVYKNMRLGVVALIFRARMTGGSAGPTDESTAVDWWTADGVAAQTNETFAVRVLDALDSTDVTARVHDGVHLLSDEVGRMP